MESKYYTTKQSTKEGFKGGKEDPRTTRQKTTKWQQYVLCYQ